MADEVRVVVGLGNPGARYVRTRHNIGFRVLDRLAAELGAGPESQRDTYRVAWATLGELRVALLRPRTYMNRSGVAVRRFGEETVVPPGSHLVVLDDVALPFGSLRLRGKGSAGGHRGLESILEQLGTEAVPRMRLGVGRGEEERDLADHVLDPFSGEEERMLAEWLETAGTAVRVALTEGLDAAMNRFNR
jgi:PTH1 family peptidyl-tRNA hydrolase